MIVIFNFILKIVFVADFVEVDIVPLVMLHTYQQMAVFYNDDV